MTVITPYTLGKTLLVVDGSPASMPLLHQVLAITSGALTTTFLLVSPQNPADQAHFQELLAPILATYRSRSPVVRVVSPETGDEVVQTIVACANDLGSQLIAIAIAEPGDRSMRSPSKSLGEDVSLRVTVPVLTVSPDATQEKSILIQRIVIPFDGSKVSQHAFPVAVQFARQLGVPIQLVMVLDPMHALPPAYAYLSPLNRDRHEALASLQFEANQALNNAESIIRQQEIPVHSALLSGSIRRCLVDAIRPGDLVVIAVHGKGDGPGTRYSMIAHRLVQSCPAPVVSIHTPVSSLVDDACQAHWDLASPARAPIQPAIPRSMISKRINPARASPSDTMIRSATQPELHPQQSL